MSQTSPLSSRTTVVVRSLLATAETVGFATVVHIQAGGHRPGLLQIAAVTAAVLSGSLALLSGRARLLAIGIAVFGAQIVLHEGFSLAAGSSPDVHASLSPMPGMGAAVMSATSSTAISPGWHMLLTHVVIGVLTLLVLACQGVAVAAVVAGLRLLARVGSSLIELPTTGPIRRARLGSLLVLLTAAPRRGPPRWSLLTS